MYGSESGTVPDDSERTAFRRAEKKYKLYYEDTYKSSKKKRKPKPVDLSEVLDFKSILESYNRKAVLPPGIAPVQCGFDGPVFSIENRPGFYFIPGTLSVEEQCQWIKESLTSFPQPPNRTNHSAFYGSISDLFYAAKEKKVLVAEGSSNSECSSAVGNGDADRWKFFEEHEVSSKGNSGKSVSASVLLRKLRWSTLGLQFEWSKRNYDVSLPHNKIPDTLCQLAKRLAKPAMPPGEEFQPEGAIVNYFGQGDMLGGHLDDMEADWSKPIVSMSLGCKAIFLLGGKLREDPPIAMFLQAVMLYLWPGSKGMLSWRASDIHWGENAEIVPLEKQFSDEEDVCVLEYIQTSRININIRQVF